MGGQMTTVRDLDDLVEARREAINSHQAWKQRSLTSDLIIQQKWSTVWPDLTAGLEAPTVENIYLEAQEDKAARRREQIEEKKKEYSNCIFFWFKEKNIMPFLGPILLWVPTHWKPFFCDGVFQ